MQFLKRYCYLLCKKNEGEGYSVDVENMSKLKRHSLVFTLGVWWFVTKWSIKGDALL